MLLQVLLLCLQRAQFRGLLAGGGVGDGGALATGWLGYTRERTGNVSVSNRAYFVMQVPLPLC